MDDLQFGKRNKRGDWAPDKPLEVAPILVFPPQPMKFLKWLPGYFLPWNAVFMVLGAVYWFWLTPDMTTVNAIGRLDRLPSRPQHALVLLFYGA
jgi:hypothetical protein